MARARKELRLSIGQDIQGSRDEKLEKERRTRALMQKIKGDIRAKFEDRKAKQWQTKMAKVGL
jgi:hypothetical protein